MIKKAVIPAAGLGTSFLPATKAQPKEMLPIIDIPTIQYVVQECVDSGIEDILSDEASMITGSIGMIPSSSLGATSCGLYEPIHGSAPDIAGMDVANPIGTILSVAMMLRFSFDMPNEADCIENAVSAVLDDGFRTADIMSDGCKKVGCSEMGNLIISRM